MEQAGDDDRLEGADGGCSCPLADVDLVRVGQDIAKECHNPGWRASRVSWIRPSRSGPVTP